MPSIGSGEIGSAKRQHTRSGKPLSNPGALADSPRPTWGVTLDSAVTHLIRWIIDPRPAFRVEHVQEDGVGPYLVSQVRRSGL
jgi:hypothetical protein